MRRDSTLRDSATTARAQIRGGGGPARIGGAEVARTQRRSVASLVAGVELRWGMTARVGLRPVETYCRLPGC